MGRMIPEEIKRRLAVRLAFAFADDETKQTWNNVVPKESQEAWLTDIDAILSEIEAAGYVILSREELRLAMSSCQPPATLVTPDSQEHPYVVAWQRVQTALYPEMDGIEVDPNVERDAIRLYRAAVNLYYGRITQAEYDAMLGDLFPEAIAADGAVNLRGPLAQDDEIEFLSNRP
jgi:hypothetical protein